jgi:integrase
VRAEEAAGTSLTLDAVCERYMRAVGDHLKGARNMEARIGILIKHFGPAKLITDITHEDVVALIAKRRRDKVPRTQRLIAPATVNLTTQQLLKVFNWCRAQRVAFPVEPTWRKLWLKVQNERERLVGRELGDAEVERLDAALRPDYAPLFDFALLTGKRQAECVSLSWGNVHWDTGWCEWLGKGGRVVRVQITPKVRAILEPLRGHHPEKVFTYAATQTRRAKADGTGARVKGRRYPITLTGLRALWWDLQPKAGLKHIRFHDLRHTAATRVLRDTGNLKIAATMLDHAGIEMVARFYGHITDAEVGAAMDGAARDKNHPSFHPSGRLKLVKSQ